jgi:CBS-domain-containing membrane protein
MLMPGPSESIQPSSRSARTARRRLGWRHELLLVLLPTLTVLAVFAVVERFTQQRLLFASLASSAFLIYLDPLHGTNSTRTLLLAQLGAAIAGSLAFAGLGPGYGAAATAMIATIALMVTFDAVHPPACGDSAIVRLSRRARSNLLLFVLAVGLVAVLVALERSSLWLLARAHLASDKLLSKPL